MSDTTQSSSPRSNRRPGKLLFLGVLFVLGAVVAVPWAMASGARDAFTHHRGCRGGEVTEDGLRDKLGFGAGFALQKVDATQEQRDQVDAILDDLAPRLFAAKTEGTEIHAAVGEAISGETVDAEQLELLRQQGLVHADEVSKIVLDSAVELAEVLTPDQRAELMQRMLEFHGE